MALEMRQFSSGLSSIVSGARRVYNRSRASLGEAGVSREIRSGRAVLFIILLFTSAAIYPTLVL